MILVAFLYCALPPWCSCLDPANHGLKPSETSPPLSCVCQVSCSTTENLTNILVMVLLLYLEFKFTWYWVGSPRWLHSEHTHFSQLPPWTFPDPAGCLFKQEHKGVNPASLLGLIWQPDSFPLLSYGLSSASFTLKPSFKLCWTPSPTFYLISSWNRDPAALNFSIPAVTVVEPSGSPWLRATWRLLGNLWEWCDC